MKNKRLALAILALLLISVTPSYAVGSEGQSRADRQVHAFIAKSDADRVPLIVTDTGKSWLQKRANFSSKQIGRLGLYRIFTGADAANAAVDALPDNAIFANRINPLPKQEVAVGPQALTGTDYLGITGATAVHDAGIDGTGQTVAIIDTGILQNHPYFKNDAGVSRIVAQACYVYNQSPYNADFPCLNGADSDTRAGAAAIDSFSAYDQYITLSHGSHVAGIAAGNLYAGAPSGVTDGMAPNANIISVRVFGSAGAWDSDILAALSFVYEKRNTFDIAAVNLSLGYLPAGACDGASAYSTIFGQLRTAGIAPLVAAGNDGARGKISVPACMPNAMAVAATTPSDTIASFSNLKQGIDLAAPGVSILSLAPGLGYYLPATGSFEAWNGTSMATPVAAGAFALIQESTGGQSVDSIRTALQTTATLIDTGAITGTPRINVDAVALATAAPVITDVSWSNFEDFSVSWNAPASGNTPTGYQVLVNGEIVGSVGAATRTYSGSFASVNSNLIIRGILNGQIGGAASEIIAPISISNSAEQVSVSPTVIENKPTVTGDFCQTGNRANVEIYYNSPSSSLRDIWLITGTGAAQLISEQNFTPAVGSQLSATNARKVVVNSPYSWVTGSAALYLANGSGELSQPLALTSVVSALNKAAGTSPVTPTNISAVGGRESISVNFDDSSGKSWIALVDGVATAVAKKPVTLSATAGSHSVSICSVKVISRVTYTSEPSAEVLVNVQSKVAQTVTISGASEVAVGAKVQLAVSISSALSGTWSVTTPALCSVSKSGLVTTKGAGICTVVVTQAGNATFSASTGSYAITIVGPAVMSPGTPKGTSKSGITTFTWGAPKNAVVAGMTGYLVEYRTQVGGLISEWSSTNVFSAKWVSAVYAAGTQIQIRITALAPYGNSASVTSTWTATKA